MHGIHSLAGYLGSLCFKAGFLCPFVFAFEAKAFDKLVGKQVSANAFCVSTGKFAP